MKTKTEELATSKLTTTPESIWRDVVCWANSTYDGMWYEIKEQQVKELVRKSHKKLGFGNTISTIENTPDYNKMTDQDRPFLHCSACFPHPKKPDTNMQMMIFANPYLLGLLKGLVDIFIDATFSPCTPNPFYQCLIIMVYDSQTSSYIPVIYALMTHKVTELYGHVFSQINMLMQGKMKVRTYTIDFKRALMNMCELHFGKKVGGVTHVDCLFHLKKAWLKYLKKHCGLAQSRIVGTAMEVGGLDLLFVLPHHEVLEFGIPFVCMMIEHDLAPWELEGMEIFWGKYFVKQWIPIVSAWNVRKDDGTIIDMVNRTNNALEGYNHWFNGIFLKQPTVIEFVQLVEKESRYQAQKLDFIHSGKRRETEHDDLWVPEISLSYIR
jgi:hypothetical protein